VWVKKDVATFNQQEDRDRQPERERLLHDAVDS